MKATRHLLFALSACVTATTALAQSQPEIVGGTPATDGRYPWMVPLLFSKTADNFKAQNCGGSLVSPTKVLTAAHCLGPQYDILVGSQDLKSGQGERIRVTKATAHPNYSAKKDAFDVAVLTLERPVTTVAPVRFIASKAEELAQMPDGQLLTVIGYGNTKSTGQAYSSVLREVSVPVVNRSTCNTAPMYPGKIGKTEFCAGFVEGGKDSCQGDSGGPLFRQGASAQDDVQVGIVSWGQGCALRNKPGVYARMGVVGAWVQEQISLP